MSWTPWLAAALTVPLLAGCSGSSGGTPPDASVCAEALDEADRGFTAFGENIRVVQQALDLAFAGHPDAGRVALRRVERVSPDRYKQLERECRDAVAP